MKAALSIAILLGTFASAKAVETDNAISASAGSRESRWKEDVDYFAQELPARHLDFFKLLSKKQFDREVHRIESELPQSSDEEVVFKLMRLGARLGVAHTWVGFPPKGPTSRGYPFMMHWFDDGLAVVTTPPEYREIIGSRVLRIGPLTPRQAVARMAPYISYENKIWLYKQSPLWLRNAELLKHLRIAKPDGRVGLSLVRPDGKSVSVEIPPIDSFEPARWIPAWQALNIPPVLNRKSHAPYWYEFVPDAHALYIQYRSCVDLPTYPFANFASEVLSFADSNVVRRMIVDLRSNEGGANSVVKPLVTGLKSRPGLKGKGHLYLLIGPSTFSAGLDAAIELRNELGATLVGQPTGGKPNCYAESPLFVLPNSQMEVHYSTKYFRMIPNGDPPSFEPDVHVPVLLKNFLAGRDLALEVALNRPAQ